MSNPNVLESQLWAPLTATPSEPAYVPYTGYSFGPRPTTDLPKRSYAAGYGILYSFSFLQASMGFNGLLLPASKLVIMT